MISPAVETMAFIAFLASLLFVYEFHKNRRLIIRQKQQTEALDAFISLITGTPTLTERVGLLNLSKEYSVSSEPPHTGNDYQQGSARYYHYYEQDEIIFDNLRIVICVYAGSEYYYRTIYGHMFPKNVVTHMRFARQTNPIVYAGLIENLVKGLKSHLESDMFHYVAKHICSVNV